ncbi:hypothetical protein [Sphingobacterium psychroaquaticum]|uniref:Uncharacterized protein n=1 Tax=Sphingobacterium psychroaquaticum TaxID=561061 RepID=A0A1X7I1C5_9SPHI|nr:hypothetical protein [Sphingobacterium psychroaquaticum]SMG07781.1 hypothetical protein SAMN05660862_0317 [Sphingobacterium psychroaquaticum]
MKNQRIKIYIALLSICALCIIGCTKVEYTEIKEPAYLRVFNNLNYVQTLGSKDDKVPYFCMLINPTMDATGEITGAEVIGDFFDKRDAYAPPYPSHIGNSTSLDNPEYPGKRNVLVAPMLNGFDLSSWAQVPSGSLRIVFAYRPKNTVPFLQLESHLKKDILIDTVINLGSKEVYTLHLLQKDFVTKEHGLLLREENFHKLPLSDSLVYVNFYNMSAKGFVEADASLKDGDYRLRSFMGGIKEEMNIFLSLYEDQGVLSHMAPTVPGYKGKYMTRVVRNNSSSAVAPYVSFPLWASSKTNGIQTTMWQRFDFFVPGMDITNNPIHSTTSNTEGNWAVVNCLLNGKVNLTSPDNGTMLPNMLVNVHSGIHNPRTFATVNTLEVVNGRIYMTTIQRKFAPPIY